MREFRIPRSFMLFGQRITVEWKADLIDEIDCVGVARLRRNTIELQDGTGNQVRRPLAQTEQTFCHELIHWMLHLLGEDERDKDEKFVDKMGSMLHQALTTMEYE